MNLPLPPREREGARARRGKGEGAATDQRVDPCTTLTRRLRRHPLPGRERGFSSVYFTRSPVNGFQPTAARTVQAVTARWGRR
ncbi:hypothetical protein D3867_22585 (plasmid) [Azospirillum argentinense]|uniref:Uncharacterized protein n=1 Tax=Azospirillum brasilense TaxID=192 RepID=A0A4D8Q7V5_AZOBR|nr:hypothetical protein D3867_22585 [Azospirillum argentinense]